jgi:pimeloyl-ACP methyl ester carboxylesterase
MTAKYADLNGLRMWYDEHGEGEPLVMLHPGGVDSRAFGPNLQALALRFHVFLPEQRGHGHTADPDGPYSYQLMADDTIRFLEEIVGGPARLLGMSDGAVVALHVAHKRVDLADRVICVAGVFDNRGWPQGAIDPVVEPPAFQVASYEKFSPDGIAHLPTVVRKLNEMHANGPKLSRKDLQTISCRTLVMIGDDDEVTLEHAVEFYRALPNGELAIVPGTSHGLLVEKPSLCNQIMIEFMTSDPIQTLAPIRRA